MMKVNLKLSVLIALLGLAIFICIPHTWAQDKDDKNDKGDKEKNEVKIGFEIAPVSLNLKGKNRDLPRSESWALKLSARLDGL